jgi:hypothetical protein
MHREGYHIACHPDPAAVLGIRLRPFTLGHAHLLARVGSPFLSGGEPQLGDVVLGVEICSREYGSAVSFLEQANAARVIEKAARKWLRRNMDEDLGPISEFVHYVSAAAQGPRFWVENKEASESGADWLQSIKLGLMRTGRTTAEAMETPLGEAMWDYAAHWESEGALKMHTETDEGLIDAVNKAKQGPAPDGLVPLNPTN